MPGFDCEGFITGRGMFHFGESLCARFPCVELYRLVHAGFDWWTCGRQNCLGGFQPGEGGVLFQSVTVTVCEACFTAVYLPDY